MANQHAVVSKRLNKIAHYSLRKTVYITHAEKAYHAWEKLN